MFKIEAVKAYVDSLKTQIFIFEHATKYALRVTDPVEKTRLLHQAEAALKEMCVRTEEYNALNKN